MTLLDLGGVLLDPALQLLAAGDGLAALVDAVVDLVQSQAVFSLTCCS